MASLGALDTVLTMDAEILREADTCIVIDTNEWIRLKWLGTPIGLTFLSTLQSTPSAIMAIPEVLERELDKHRTAASRALLLKLQGAIDEVASITGDRLAGGIVTLTEEKIDVAIRERQIAVSSQIIYPPIDIEEVRRALDRVNAETPPNGPKNQQMKDSLLWEACTSLAEHYTVLLVTGDNGFYEGRQKGKLAANLAEEPAVRRGALLVFPSLEEAMKSFAPDNSVTLDSDDHTYSFVNDALAAKSLDELKRHTQAVETFLRFELRGVSPSYFRTEVPHEFAVSFVTFFHVFLSRQHARQGEIAVKGECKLNTRSGMLEEVIFEGIHWRPENGGDWAEITAIEVQASTVNFSLE